MDKLIYTVRTVCKNCGTKQTVKIPKGSTITYSLGFLKCKKCNCNELSEKISGYNIVEKTL